MSRAALRPALLAFILVVGLALVVARNYEVIFERIEGNEMNPEYMGPGSYIRIRRNNKSTTPGLYHNIEIIKAVPRNMMVEVTLYEMRDNKLVPSWLKYKNNFCDYVEKEKRPIFDTLAKLYRFEKCPIVGLYSVENWRPDDKLLPPVLPGPDHMMFEVKLFTPTAIVHKYGVLFMVDRNSRGRGKARAGSLAGPAGRTATG